MAHANHITSIGHREILLPSGHVVLVDEEDYADISLSSWYACKPGRSCTVYARNARILMHRKIMLADKGQVVDHKNGNGLDNRRANLRLVDRSTNPLNQRRHKHATSKYKGLCWEPRRSVWRVVITFKNVRHRFGHFKNQEDAARAYDARARELHGEFAAVNFPLNENERCCL